MKVLLVEDEQLFAKSVLKRLAREGYETDFSETVNAAEKWLEQQSADLILLDVRLGDGSGLDLLQKIKTKPQQQAIPIIMMTAYGELEDAVSAMKLGAADYLKKPVDLDELMLTLNKVAGQQQLSQKLNYSKVRESHRNNEEVTMIGHSQIIETLKQQIERIAQLASQSDNEHPLLLIQGETGTGKDLVARYYHQSGQWRNKPFVHINCAALPDHLLEAELFGYERGAFTNANQAKAGLIEVAEDGTLFLDEVADLPLDLQAKLLNVLEHRKVRRLGSVKEYRVNAHFVSATNRDLKKMVEQERFRADLYFRLNVLNIQIPPLRERRQDILPIAAYFTEKIARRYGLKSPGFSQATIETLQNYTWPGNIRELQHVLERAMMLTTQGKIEATQLMLNAPLTQAPSKTAVTIDEWSHLTLEQVEKMMIEKALQRTAGNVSRAARELGLTRMALRYRMEKYRF